MSWNVLTWSARAAVAGSSVFGMSVLYLGGASRALIAAVWGLGWVLVGLKEWSEARRRARVARVSQARSES